MICIVHEANERMHAWCRAARLKRNPEHTAYNGGFLEIAGLLVGNAERGRDYILVTESYLLGVKPSTGEPISGMQKLTSGSVEVTAEQVAMWYSDWIASGRDPKEVIGWWHSHGTMNAFQSSQDKETTIERFGKRRFAVALTYNAKGERYGDIHLFEPFTTIIEKANIYTLYPQVDIDTSVVETLIDNRKPEETKYLVDGRSLKQMSKKEVKRLHHKLMRSLKRRGEDKKAQGYKHITEIYENAGIAWADEDEDDRVPL